MKKLLNTLRRDEAASTVQMRLLVLLAVDVMTCIVALSAAGALHFKLFNALVAATAAASAVASLPAARRWFSTGPAKTAGVSPSHPSVARTKKILILVMLAGAIAYIGGRATFALFSAETSNPNSSMASGTLTMGNSVNSGTVCMSSSGATLDNINANCNAMLTLQNMAPGVSSLQAQLTIENDGSIDASKFYLFAPYPRTALSAPLTSGVAVPSLTVAALTAPVAIGNQIMVSYAGHSQTFTASAPAVVGATTISVSGSPAANFSYPINARVDNTGGNASPSNTDCYDAKTTTTPVGGASVGTDLNFNSPTGNPLCSALMFWVQEQTTGGNNYCWYGLGSPGSTPSASGQCRTPTMPKLSATLSTSGAITALPVTALTGNVQSGDHLTIKEGANTATVQASGDAFINGTSIPINSWTPNFAYTNAATITDTDAFGALNGDPGDTISQFDTSRPQTGRIQLYPVTGPATVNNTAAVELNKHGSPGYQRFFYIGVYMPAPAGTPQNQLQGLVSTFGLSWHIDQ